MATLNDISDEEPSNDVTDEEEKNERIHGTGSVSYLRPGMTPALQAQAAQVPVDAAAADEEDEREGDLEQGRQRHNVKVPVTSHRTPKAIISQRLLVYDR